MMTQSQQIYPIEHGIPVPEMDRSNNRKKNYPYNQLEVGDSFFCPSPGNARLTATTTHYNAHWKGARKFITRSVEGGVRVWRIK